MHSKYLMKEGRGGERREAGRKAPGARKMSVISRVYKLGLDPRK